jgi:hypothetical protein
MSDKAAAANFFSLSFLSFFSSWQHCRQTPHKHVQNKQINIIPTKTTTTIAALKNAILVSSCINPAFTNSCMICVRLAAVVVVDALATAVMLVVVTAAAALKVVHAVLVAVAVDIVALVVVTAVVVVAIEAVVVARLPICVAKLVTVSSFNL